MVEAPAALQLAMPVAAPFFPTVPRGACFGVGQQEGGKFGMLVTTMGLSVSVCSLKDSVVFPSLAPCLGLDLQGLLTFTPACAWA